MPLILKHIPNWFWFLSRVKRAEAERWDSATHVKYGCGKEYYLLHINILYAVSQKLGYYTASLSEHYGSQILDLIMCGLREKCLFHCFILPFPEQRGGNRFFRYGYTSLEKMEIFLKKQPNKKYPRNRQKQRFESVWKEGSS